MNDRSRSSAQVAPALHDASAVAQALGSNAERGLTGAEATRRLAHHGRNELRAVVPMPVWRRALAQLHSPLVYLLLGAISISLAAWLVEGRVGWPVDGIVIAIVVLVNAALGFAQESRAAEAVAALARMTAVTASVLRDGERGRIPSAELVPGDILLLEEGDAVGADARLVLAANLRVQEASLTGESVAVPKDAAALLVPPPLAEQSCMVFKGTAVVQGTGRAIVVATGMQTQIGAIATMLDATVAEPTPLQKEVALIGRMLGIAVSAIAVIVVVTVFLVSDINGPTDVVTVLLMGVSLAVAAIPEGLPTILTVVLALGVQRMAGRNAVFKSLSSVETLGSATVICTDKTGTLTRSEMTIERIMTASGSSRVTGVGYAPVGRLEDEFGAVPDGPLRAEQIVVLSGGSLAGNAGLQQTDDGVWEVQGDPTEAAFLVAERKAGVEERRKSRFERLAEIPFTSARKMMSTIERDHEHGGERIIVSKGAPDVLITHCSYIRIGMDVVPFDNEHRARALGDVERLSSEALRTLAVAYRPLFDNEDSQADQTLEHDLIFVGTVGILDPPRKEAAVAIAETHRAGIRVMMITGDHPRTASNIAHRLGIIEHGAQALTGADLDAMDDARFADAVRTTSVFARVAPAHKLRIISALQAGGDIVAMTGDGVNDAPALKVADIGVAMGVTGTEVTKEAAKMILADDNFATIIAAVREGRGIFNNIRKFLRYLLSSNMGEVMTVLFGVIGAKVIGLSGPEGSELVLPLLTTQILWINLSTDSGPALAMGIDPETDDVMARPPRGANERTIDARMWRGVIATGLVMSLTALLTIDLYLPGGLIPGSQSLDQARTAGFTVLVFAQLFNCFNVRSETASAFRHLFTNRWLWSAVALSVLLQIGVVNFGPLNLAFGTVPLSLEQWLICVALASSVLWFGEIRKLALRRPGK
ncbi:MAG TPA: cation-translocating P-type ATPase [Devosia sp.]|nr:cation-translocating P-type ATPase [Devosia sp.]